MENKENILTLKPIIHKIIEYTQNEKDYKQKENSIIEFFKRLVDIIKDNSDNKKLP